MYIERKNMTIDQAIKGAELVKRIDDTKVNLENVNDGILRGIAVGIVFRATALPKVKLLLEEILKQMEKELTDV
jgi:hypothetical protein